MDKNQLKLKDNSNNSKELDKICNGSDINLTKTLKSYLTNNSQLDGDKIELFLNDTGSPALIKDPGDFDSIFVVMPMKG